MIFNKNFLEISQNYEYFLFDVWGVIHDGISAYPNVLNVIKQLNNENKTVCFLSNAPRRAKKVAEVLKNYGITQDLYQFIMTSGEAVFYDLKKDENNNFQKFNGNKYLYIGPEKDLDLLHDSNYQIVDDAAQANFALTTGFDAPDSTILEKIDQIESAIKHNLHLICANPDIIVVRKNGDEMLCAGVIAQKYLELGGQVSYYGKPYEAVYNVSYELLNSPPKDKILAIGDGLETDILGANKFNIDSVLVTSGILSNKLNVQYNQKADESKVLEQCEIYNSFPQYVIPNL